MNQKKGVFFSALLVFVFCSVFYLQLVSAAYIVDFSFTVPQSVYTTGERVEVRGYLLLKNYSSNGTLVSNYSAIASGTVNLSVRN